MESALLDVQFVFIFVAQESKAYEHGGSFGADVSCCPEASISETGNKNRN